MANPVLNPSFEYPGVSSGQAESWTEVYPEEVATGAGATAEEVASFDIGTAGDPTPYEGFLGGWKDNELAQSSFALSDIVSAFFEYGDHQREDFESSWALPQTVNPSAPVWNHQSNFAYWKGNFAIALFNSAADAYENFEQSWDDVEDAVAALAEGTTAAATFDAANDSAEDFEEEWRDVEDAVANLAAGTTSAAMFDAGANAYENFEGSWPSLVLP